MASDALETSPLLPTRSASSIKSGKARAPRNVTFNPSVSHSSSTTGASAGGAAQQPYSVTPLATLHNEDGKQPMLSALNSRIRRRHSHSAAQMPGLPPAPKSGAQRTTRVAQKLKLLPNPDHGDDGPDEESGRDVYSQFTRIKDPMARRDAARLGRADRERLPRVTAYCTANAYRLEDLMKFLRGKAKTRAATPKLFDECIYTPYSYSRIHDGRSFDEQVERRPQTERRHSDSEVDIENGLERMPSNSLDLHTQAGDVSLDNGESSVPNHTAQEMHTPHDPSADTLDFDTQVHIPEVFLFNYGTVVLWGMTVKEEERFLNDIAKFETEKLAKDDVQIEAFNFYYTREYQARIYNDFISLRDKRNYMTKLAISHALSQSVKTSLYEDLVDNTIDVTKEIPAQIASTGKVNLSRKEINMQIGELFILRINIHLQGSVLDSPELMWAEPQLDPVYQAVRSYLEMDQRVGLLTERLEVIADLLAVLKDQLAHSHGEYLEWIVIILIAAEILVAAVNIVVDIVAGGD